MNSRLMHSTQLGEWLSYIDTVHPVGWDLGLARVGEVGRRLDVLKPAPTVFLVAGTNGKGSTVEYIDAFCRSQGLKTGKTTSPYLMSYNDQFCLDGRFATDHELIEAFEAIEVARGSITLTYFEYGALAALWLFKHHRMDVAILEIGLGAPGCV